MDRNRLFKTLAYLIVSLFLVNYVAIRLYLYYTIWYFDVITHFWGGICVGLGMLWLFFKEEFSLRFILKILAGVLIIGILWEVFEIVVNNATAQNPWSAIDSLSDILFDVLGGALAIFYFYVKGYNSSNVKNS